MFIGFLILLGLGIVITILIWKPLLPSSIRNFFSKPTEGFQTSPWTTPIGLVPGVFSLCIEVTANGIGLGDRKFSRKDNARAACQRVGARLALASEVRAIADADQSFSEPGWVEHETLVHIPLKKGQKNNDMNGPAVIRFDAEVGVDCDSDFPIYDGYAYCYGLYQSDAILRTEIDEGNNNYIILDPKSYPRDSVGAPIDKGVMYTPLGYPRLSSKYATGYTLRTKFKYVEYQSSETILQPRMIGFENQVSQNNILSLRDAPSSSNGIFDRAQTYTIFDLDALYTQKDAMVADKEQTFIHVRNTELGLIQAHNTFKDTGGLKANTYGFINADENRIRHGYFIYKKANYLFKDRIAYFTSQASPFHINPYPSQLSVDGTPKLTYAQYLNLLMSAITQYYTQLIGTILIHPVGFISSGLINYPSYINSFGLTPLVDGDWEYSDENGAISVQRPPPYGGCGTYNYEKCAPGANSEWRHCPNGVWWRDRETRWAWEGCSRAGAYKPAWDVGKCYLEWKQFRTPLTGRHFYTFQQYTAANAEAREKYLPTFMSSSDGWYPTAYSPIGAAIITKFNTDKKTLADSYGITDVKSTYRWKPVSFLGTITDINKNEAKQAATSVAYFNFSNPGMAENQLRVSGKSPYNLYYSPFAKAVPEFTSSQTANSFSPTNNSAIVTGTVGLSAAATIGGSVLSRMGGARGKAAGAALSAFGVAAGIAGSAMATVSNSKTTAASITINASNSSYNDSVTLPFTSTLFKSLPYHTKVGIYNWATIRRDAIFSYLKIEKTGFFFSDGTATNDLKSPSPSDLIYGLSASLSNEIYDAIAQTYYRLKNGRSFMVQILDIYQIGTSLFDVRFTENSKGLGTGGGDPFSVKINALNAQYRLYRKQPLSEQELINLEKNYDQALSSLYDSQTQYLEGTQTDCGVLANYIRIKNTTNAAVSISQIMAINNAGINVAYSVQADVNIATVEIPAYQDVSGQTFYDSGGMPYPVAKSQKIAQGQIAAAKYATIALLTDGTYTPRLNPVFIMKANSFIQLNLGNTEFDITAIQLIYPTTTTGSFTIELYNTYPGMVSTATAPAIKTLTGTFNTTGTYNSAVGDPADGTRLLRPRGNDRVACPTSVYSQYKVGRFFAKGKDSNEMPTIITKASDIVFTGYAEGPDGATTFNEKYNAGLPLEITSPTGIIMYKPKTIFNIKVAPAVLPCNDPDRMEDVFKDHIILLNSRAFLSRPDIYSAVTTGSTTTTTVRKYPENYVFKPYQILQARTLTTDNYQCAYQWKERVYHRSNYSLISTSMALTTDGSPMTLESDGLITRVGVFKYVFDNSSPTSLAITYDISNSFIYNSINEYNAAYPASPLTPLSPIHTLKIPYFDSTTLDDLGGICPVTDCSDPLIIDDIITQYNGYNTVSKNDKILRVTKAVTVTSLSCEYQYMTASSGANTFKSMFYFKEPEPNVPPAVGCTYKLITDISGFPTGTATGTGTGTGTSLAEFPKKDPASHISEQTPYLALVYDYVSNITKTLYSGITSTFSDLSGLVYPQANPTGEGVTGKLSTYRKDTNAAAGQLRTVSDMGRDVTNENGKVCTTKCDSPEIIQSFFAAGGGLYNTGTTYEKITQLNNVGMDASGYCDFTFSSSPITMSGNLAVVSNEGKTRGLKYKIKRYLNSCSYFVTKEEAPRDITPNPGINLIKTFRDDKGRMLPDTTAKPNDITSAAPFTNSQTSENSQVSMPASPIKFNSSSLVESIDYINCNSGYARAITGVSSLSQNGAFSCQGPSSGYTFGAPSTVGAVPQMLVPADVKALSGLPAANISDFKTDAIKALTGFSNQIKESMIISNDTCEYRISDNYTLPFEKTFQRVSFYTDGTTKLKSIVAANPSTSPYAYFKTSNTDGVTQTFDNNFVTNYMTLLKYLRYTWNQNFYTTSPGKTGPTAYAQGWKIGTISKIGILDNEDAIVFEAQSCKFGSFGPLDIREDTQLHYFRFTLRINPEGTFTDHRGVKVSIYDLSDSSTPFGTYRFSSTSIDQTTIATYGNPEINYSGVWYDTDPTQLYEDDARTKPNDPAAPTTNAPPNPPFSIKTAAHALTFGYYTQFRFKITSSSDSSTVNRPANRPIRGEITRIMFYTHTCKVDTSDPTKCATPLVDLYKYVPMDSAKVSVQDLSSNYVLALSGKPKCDTGFNDITDPVTSMVICDMVNPPPNSSYNFVDGNACGIGYFGNKRTGRCDLIGDFSLVTQEPRVITNVNLGGPRLRLILNKWLTINIGTLTYINGFSFITGASDKLPLRWVLEGTVNGKTWAELHTPPGTENYQYTPQNRNAEGITSFFCPGIFIVNPNTDKKSGKYTDGWGDKTFSTKDNQVATYTSYMSKTYNENSGEGFQNQRRVPPGFVLQPVTPRDYTDRMNFSESPANLPSSYILPLEQTETPRAAQTQITQKRRRMQILKFKILGMQNSASKFVHLSQLEFLTGSKKIPSNCIKFSNPQGSRKTPKEGTDALFAGPERRWVDYNKSDLLIQFNLEILPDEPITGFRFFVPQGVPNSLDAIPSKWIMYGSYDKYNWIPIHEQDGPVRLIYSAVTAVFQFNKEI